MVNQEQFSTNDSPSQFAAQKTIPNPNQQDQMTPRKSNFPFIIIVVAAICFVLMCVAILYKVSSEKTSFSSTQKAVNPSKTISVTGVSLSVPTQAITNEFITYSSSQYGYAVQYPKTWHFSKLQALIVLAGPDNPHAQQCQPNLSAIIQDCDIDIYSDPYVNAPGVGETSVEPHDVQDKNLAIQMAQLNKGSSVIPVTFKNLSGYEVSVISNGISTLNIILQGSKVSINVQFIHKASQSDLTSSELAIVNSITNQ